MKSSRVPWNAPDWSRPVVRGSQESRTPVLTFFFHIGLDLNYGAEYYLRGLDWEGKSCRNPDRVTIQQFSAQDISTAANARGSQHSG